ncbi:MAG: (d)CMP kinase [Tenericutes bacterium]|nr:MAG: (d)CMP kinase [Mycoplasmatota bacterium]
MKKINIAIDGPSGSGKSTAAKAVAKELGLKYINTGLVYRSIAFYVIDNSIPLKEKDIVNSLKDIKIKLLRFEKVDLNGQKLFDELREDKVSKVAAIVASMTPVREFALKIQRYYASTKGIVMDGRDTTFKIMPKADLKIFLDTDVKERAKRRVNQNKSLGYDINYDEVLKEIKARDKLDRNRKKDPLHKTKDAILIDSTNISLEEVIEKIIKLAKERL